MPRPVALQLYSLRELAKNDFLGVLDTVAGIGYPAVELAGLHGHDPKAVRKKLDKLGVKVSSAHEKIFDAKETGRIVEEAGILGYKHVVGGFGKDQFGSEDQIKANAAKINDAVERFSKSGLKVNIHNHWWEYDAPKKGELMLDLCPKAGPQFDIYWIATGGADPAKLIAKYGKRCSLLHVKDGPCDAEKAMTAVGKGKVDIKAALAAAEKTPIEFYIVEIDRCDGDMVQAVTESYKYLVGNKLATGKK